MAYMNRWLRNLMNEIDENFELPTDWDEFVYNVEKNHNLIIKNKGSYYCTNCQQTFDIKGNIGKIYKCPSCSKRLEVKSYRLKNFKYKDNILLVQKCQDSLVLRIFEMLSIYRADKQEFEYYVDEYARKLMNEEYRELRNERIQPAVTAYSVNHVREDNGKWRLYEGWYRGTENLGYLYKNNLKEVLENTKYERTRVWEAVVDNCDRGYDIKHLLRESEYPLFETLVELKLYNLAECADRFFRTGSFYKIFGVEKKFYEFMKDNNITYPEYEALKQYPCMDINKIRFLTNFSGSEIERIKDYMSLDKFINYFTNKGYSDIHLYIDYLGFAKTLGYDLKNKRYLFPENLKELHDEYEKQIKLAKQEVLTKAISKRAKKLNKNIFKNKMFIVFPADSVQALIDESTQQNNCVRTYADRYADGECDIYFMRKTDTPKESLVTVEVRKNKVVQKRIKNNKETTEKQNKFLKTWERKVLNRVAT